MKCKEIGEESLHSNHPGLAQIYNNLGSLLFREEKYEESLHYYLKCKRIQEEIYAYNHPAFINLFNKEET